MMKQLIICALLLCNLTPVGARRQMSVKQAWKWVAGGPIKGVTDTLFKLETAEAGNSVRLKLDYADFAADEKAFMNNFEHQLEEAERGGMTVMPVLLSDQDIHDAEGIEIPQVRFLRRYPNDFAENGDGYLITPFNNGKKRASKQLDDNPYWGSDFAESLRISKSDAAAFAGRTATKNILAYVNVVMRRFYADSRIEGWDIYYHPGESLSNESEASVWGTSHLIYAIGMSSFMVVTVDGEDCDIQDAADADEALATLELFSRSHVFWYSGKSLPEDAMGKFKFRHINTDRDSADLVP